MRVLNLALAGLLFACLVVMWSQRAGVVEAYTDPRPPLELRFDGLDLVVETAASTPSPYLLERPLPLVVPMPGPLGAAEPEPVLLTGGTAEIGGLVLGPDGPVAGATVRVERHTAAGSVAVDLVTDADGTWKLDGLLGGRFRVRSFVPGLLMQRSPDVFFLDENGRFRTDALLEGPSSIPVLEAHHVDTVTVGDAGPVVFTAGLELVDAEGRLVLMPQDRLQLGISLIGPVTLLSANTVRTNEFGAGSFLISCQDVGPVTALLAQVLDETQSFPLFDCVPLPELADPDSTVSDSTGPGVEGVIGGD